MKKSRWLFGFVVLGLGWAVLQMTYWPFKDSGANHPVKDNQAPSPNSGSLALESESNPVRTNKPASFEEKFKMESARVGQVDPNPEGSFRRLRDWAQLLARDELTKLKVKALNPALNGDDRGLAIFLLGLSPKEEAISDLGEIARSPVLESENVRATEFESIFRAQAAENMIRPDYLELSRRELGLNIAKSQIPLVVDRSQRGLLSLDQSLSPRIPPPADQDQAALKKLLGQPRIQE
ncbi:MAG: hypothetical protein IPK04_20770 [Bdellovibrionales bacterium]|nr:hypothetical protein [Bdellovibrionales bacterium]